MATPFVLLNCAMSVDGYIDDTTADRLALSNAEDFDRGDAARAAGDATLIGASTLRRDNPLKVSVTGPGGLSPDLTTLHTRFLTASYLPKAAS